MLVGGHVEPGEELEQAIIREVMEETGISVDSNQLKVLLLYESVFPVLIKQGFPARHHIGEIVTLSVFLNDL